jgi:hypothetical protein
MRKLLLPFFFFLLMVQLPAQVNVPVFGNIRYLKGYVKELRGENIGYFSALPEFANTALLTRCTDGMYNIEWETESIPESVQGRFVYFAWVAAHSKATSKGDRKFDLFVNDRKALTFETFKGKSAPFWTFSGADGDAVVFEWKTDDGAGDAHGYMYLRVPVDKVIKGKPLKLRIVGHAEDSRDWYMTFKYEFAETITVSPVSLVTVDNLQPIQVMATHFGKDVPVTISVSGQKKANFVLKAGLNTFEVFHPVVASPAEVMVEAQVKGKEKQQFRVELKPMQYREVHLIHHAHYDVGYSHLQEEVVNIHNNNISNALRYIDASNDYPAEARYKWNIETTLAIENFLKIATEEQKAKLISGIKAGRIGIGGLYANIMTGICQPEELFQLTHHARQLEQDWGIEIPAVMIGDIPGLTWSTIPALAKSGIRYFSNGPNFVGAFPYEGDRVGNSNINWKDRPFWWVGPDGTDKILFWMAGKGYSSWHGFKAGDIATPRGKKKISAYMDELDKAGYPYEMVQWRYNIVADNGPTDSLISVFVADWNRKYKSPKMILNTVDAMFKEFESRYGDRLPVFSGDLTPYWEDGAYSTAAEMALNRLNSEKLTSLETLYSLRAAEQYPALLFSQAWKKILLWDEHTWGAYNSISDPDLPFVISQWEYKKKYALDADSIIKTIMKPLESAAENDLIDVFNTLSWERMDVIYLNQEHSKGLIEVQDESGRPVIMQKLSDGRTALLVSVSPLSSVRLKLVRGDVMTIPASMDESNVRSLKNNRVNIEVNNETGSIQKLVYLPLKQQLVNSTKYSGLNEYLYVPGKEPAKVISNPKPVIKLKESGPILSTILVESDAPGCKRLERAITLFSDLDRIEIKNTIDKTAVREKESVHFAFPFAVSEAQKRFNTGWGGIFQPGVNQLAGSNQDYYSVQHWCDVSGQSYGMSLLLREACLIEPGALIDEQTGKYGVKTWKIDPDTSNTLFSYVMNNYWHTNYKADQEGVVEFNYALVPHGIFNLGETQRKGFEFNQPLIVLPASGKKSAMPLFTLMNQSFMVTSIVPKDKGFIIRLFNGGGIPGSCRIQWKAFIPGEMKIIGLRGNNQIADPDSPVSLPAFGIAELEIKP